MTPSDAASRSLSPLCSIPLTNHSDTERPHQAVELLIADASLADLDLLLDGVAVRDIRLVGPECDASALLLAAFAGGYDKIHLLGHGAPGSIRLGASSLGLAELSSLVLESTSGSSAMPSLHFWSCETGAGPEGRELVDGLARILGSGVSAFGGLVGSAASGGFWTPDVLSGENCTVTAPFPRAAEYLHTLNALAGPVLDLRSSVEGNNVDVEVWVKAGTTLQMFEIPLLCDTDKASWVSYSTELPLAVDGVTPTTGYPVWALEVREDTPGDGNPYVLALSTEPVVFNEDTLLVTFNFTRNADAEGFPVVIDNDSSDKTLYLKSSISPDVSVDPGELPMLYIGFDDPALDTNFDGQPADSARIGESLKDFVHESEHAGESGYFASVIDDKGTVLLYDDDGGGMPNRYVTGEETGAIVYGEGDNYPVTLYKISDSGVLEKGNEGRLALDADGKVVGLYIDEGDPLIPAGTNINGHYLNLRFDTNINPDTLPSNAASYFAVSSPGMTLSVQSVVVSSNVLRVVLSEPIDPGAVVRISYNGNAGIRMTDGDSLSSFTVGSFVHSSKYSGTLFDMNGDGVFDHISLLEFTVNSSGNVNVNSDHNAYRVVEGTDNGATTDYTAQRMVTFDLGQDTDSDGKPDSFIDEDGAHAITWLAAPASDGHIGESSMTVYMQDPANPEGNDIPVDTVIYIYDDNAGDSKPIDRMEFWTLDKNGAVDGHFGTLEIAAVNSSSLTCYVTWAPSMPDEVFDFTLAGGLESPASITLPADEFETDTKAPGLMNRVWSAGSPVVTLVYDELLDTAHAPSKNFLAVKVNGEAVDISAVGVNQNKVVITLASAVPSGASVSLSYADPATGNDTWAIQDLNGNDALSSGQPINTGDDTKAPELTGSSLSGYDLSLLFDESISGGSPADFEVTIAGETIAVTSVSASANTLILRLAVSASAGDLVRVSYDGNTVHDAAGNPAGVFSAASFVYSTVFSGTLIDTDGDGHFDFMQIVEQESADNLNDNRYRIVEGANPDASADYIAQKVLEFGLGDVDVYGRPTSFIDEVGVHPITWLETPGDKGEVARASMTFFIHNEGEADVEHQGMLYFFRSADDPATIGSLELWYTPQGASDMQKFAALDILGFETDASGNPELMRAAITFFAQSGSDYFDFGMDGDAIVLPFDEFGAPEGFGAVGLFQDTVPGDDIIVRFSDEHASGFLSDLDEDGVIDFLSVIEEGKAYPADYAVTWDDELHWTAHRIEHLEFTSHDEVHRPLTMLVEGTTISIEWADTVVENVVATATFTGESGEAHLTFIDNTGDGVPDQVRYDGADGTELLTMPATSWQYDSGNPVSAWAVVTESDNSDSIFSGLMEFDGDGNPLTLLVPDSGNDGEDHSVSIDNGRLAFDSGVQGVTIPGTGTVTVTQISSSGMRQTLVLPVSSLSAEGSMLYLPTTGADMNSNSYTLALYGGTMLRLRFPDGMLGEGDMKAWEVWSDQSSVLHFSGYQASCCSGSSNRDWLFGTSGNDTINAGNESDFIEWSGGNDTVDGGAGHDRLYLPLSGLDYMVGSRLDDAGVVHLFSWLDHIDRYTLTRLAGDNTILVHQLDGSGNTVSSVQFANGEALWAGYNRDMSICVQDMNDSGYINASPWDDEISISVNAGNVAVLVAVQGYTGDDILNIDFGTGYTSFAVRENGSTNQLYGTPSGGGSSTMLASFSIGSYNGLTVTVGEHSFQVNDVESFRFVSGEVSMQASAEDLDPTPDMTAPSLTGAIVNGNVLMLLYDETLDPVNGAGGNWFSVQVNGSASIEVSSVSVNGHAVLLELASPVSQGDSVTVTYNDPTSGNDADATQDAAGNDAAGFNSYAATNKTGEAPLALSVQCTDWYTGDIGFVTGQTLTFAVNMSEPVTVSGSPTLQLHIGYPGDGNYHTVDASYTGYDSETNSLMFRYTLTSDDIGQMSVAWEFSLNGASITDSSGNPASTSLGGQIDNFWTNVDAPDLVYVSGASNGTIGEDWVEISADMTATPEALQAALAGITAGSGGQRDVLVLNITDTTGTGSMDGGVSGNVLDGEIGGRQFRIVKESGQINLYEIVSGSQELIKNLYTESVGGFERLLFNLVDEDGKQVGDPYSGTVILVGGSFTELPGHREGCVVDKGSVFSDVMTVDSSSGRYHMISPDTGDDTVTGSEQHDDCVINEGNDQISLAGGDDKFGWYGGNTSTLDGGNGTDQIFLSLYDSGIAYLDKHGEVGSGALGYQLKNDGLIHLYSGSVDFGTIEKGGGDDSWQYRITIDSEADAAGSTVLVSDIEQFEMRTHNDTLTINFGDLDFIRQDGVVFTNIYTYDNSEAMVVQPDGRTVVFGFSYPNGSGNWADVVVRYNADGTLDRSFGDNGVVFTGFEGYDYATCIAVQEDGKIVTAGVREGSFALIRLNANGTPDYSFGTDGQVMIDSLLLTEGYLPEVITVQSDGGLLLSLNDSGGGDFVLLRVDADGHFDESFGHGDGIVMTGLPDTDVIVNTMTEQSDEKIILAGLSGDFSGGADSDFVLARYFADGSLDRSFDGDGFLTTDLGSSEEVNSVVVQMDGKILAAGNRFDAATGSGSTDFALVRYNADGSLDTSFGGGDGIVLTNISGLDVAHEVIVQSDGKIIVAGNTELVGYASGGDIAVVRYNADGSLDTSFGGGDGIEITDLGGDEDVAGVTVQSDGKIVVSGTTYFSGGSDIFMVRYNSDGTIDESYGATRLTGTMVNGYTLTLKFNELLDSTHLPAGTDFNATVAGLEATVVYRVVYDNRLVLGLDTAVTPGQLVTVAYEDPTSGNDENAIQDRSGNDASGFGNVEAFVITSKYAGTLFDTDGNGFGAGDRMLLTVSSVDSHGYLHTDSTEYRIVAGIDTTSTDDYIAQSLQTFTFSDYDESGRPLMMFMGDEPLPVTWNSMNVDGVVATIPITFYSGVDGNGDNIQHEGVLQLIDSDDAGTDPDTLRVIYDKDGDGGVDVFAAGDITTLTRDLSGRYTSMSFAVTAIENNNDQDVIAFSINHDATEPTRPVSIDFGYSGNEFDADESSPAFMFATAGTGTLSGSSSLLTGVILTFNELLDNSGRPGASAFVVRDSVTNTTYTISNVQVYDNKVALLLAATSVNASQLEVSYIVPAAGTVIQDLNGNRVGAFSTGDVYGLYYVPDSAPVWPTVEFPDIPDFAPGQYFEITIEAHATDSNGDAIAYTAVVGQMREGLFTAVSESLTVSVTDKGLTVADTVPDTAEPGDYVLRIYADGNQGDSNPGTPLDIDFMIGAVSEAGPYTLVPDTNNAEGDTLEYTFNIGSTVGRLYDDNGDHVPDRLELYSYSDSGSSVNASAGTDGYAVPYIVTYSLTWLDSTHWRANKLERVMFDDVYDSNGRPLTAIIDGIGHDIVWLDQSVNNVVATISFIEELDGNEENAVISLIDTDGDWKPESAIFRVERLSLTIEMDVYSWEYTLNGDVSSIILQVTSSAESNAIFSGTVVYEDGRPVMIDVDETNNAPTVANAIADQSATEDSAFSITVPANTFADVDAGDSLTWSATLSDGSALPSWLSFSSVTRTFSGTPLNGDVGSITVKVTATDRSSASASDEFTLTVANTNDNPVAPALSSSAFEGAPSFQLDLLSGVSDPDTGDSVSMGSMMPTYRIDGVLTGNYGHDVPDGLSLVGSMLTVDPTNVTFNSLGAGATRQIVVSYSIMDSHGAMVAQTETITITGTNDAPTVTAALSSGAFEGAPFYQLDLLGGASDPDTGDVLSVGSVTWNGSATVPAGLSLTGNTLTVDPTNASFNTLGAGATRTINVNYMVSDGHGGMVAQTETITITGTNDAPTVAAALISARNEGAASYQINLLTGASDPDTGDTLSVGSVTWDGSATAPAGLSLTGSMLTVDPSNAAFDSLGSGATRTINVSYTISDTHGGTLAQSETITITGVNDAPVISGHLTSAATEGDALYQLDLLGRASDPDNDVLSVGSVTWDGSSAAPAGLSLSGHTLSVDPSNAAFNSLHQGEVRTIAINYTISDAHGASVAQTETITITGVNDAPSSTNDSVTTPDNADMVLALSDFGVYHDAEGDALSSVTVSALPSIGTLKYDGVDVQPGQEIDPAGITAAHLIYTPVSGMSSTTIGFHVSDGAASSADYTLTVYAEHVMILDPGINTLGETTVNVPAGVSAESSTLVDPTIPTADQLHVFVDSNSDVSATLDDIHSQIESYTAALTTDVQVQSLTLTGSTDGSISIDGNTSDNDVLVIDASNLPEGTELDLNGVEFAIIIGPGTYGGGAGSNIIVADGSNQHIVLGPEDDTIHGGAGDDYVGSLGGADMLYGDAGNDTVSGGDGDDSLAGGQGNDSLVGGQGMDTALFSGTYHDYHYSYDSVADIWTVQDSESGRDGTDAVTGTELFSFTDGTHNATAHDCTVEVTYWKSGAGIEGVSSTMTDNGNDQQTAATANGGGVYGYSGLIESDYTLNGTKIVGTSEKNAVKVSDVLAVLKIANGLSPNVGAATSSYQFLASDIDKNGKVQISDVLSVLKMANNLPSATPKEWIFVDESVTGHTMTRNSVDWSVTDIAVTLEHDQDVSLIGVLRGDVDGNWVA